MKHKYAADESIWGKRLSMVLSLHTLVAVDYNIRKKVHQGKKFGKEICSQKKKVY